MSPFLRSVAVMTALLLCCTGARADRPSPNDVATNATEAQARYEEGVQAYATGRYADAIDLFRDADRRAPSAALSFNMARAYAKLGDDAGALRAYREYLRRAEKAADAPAVQRQVRALSLRLASRGIQQLTVLSTPPGASVFLDGERVGITPATSETKPGSHTLTVSLEGYAEENTRVQVPVNEAIDVRVALEAQAPASAPLPFSTPPPDLAAKATPQTAALPRPRDEPRPSSGARPLRTIGIVALGAGGAALGGALAFELLRRDSEGKAKGEQEQVSLANELDTVHARRTAARVLTGVGVGLAAIGGTLFFLSPSTSSSSPSPVKDRGAAMKLDVTATAVKAVVSGRF